MTTESKLYQFVPDFRGSALTQIRLMWPHTHTHTHPHPLSFSSRYIFKIYRKRAARSRFARDLAERNCLEERAGCHVEEVHPPKALGGQLPAGSGGWGGRPFEANEPSPPDQPGLSPHRDLETPRARSQKPHQPARPSETLAEKRECAMCACVCGFRERVCVSVCVCMRKRVCVSEIGVCVCNVGVCVHEKESVCEWDWCLCV